MTRNLDCLLNAALKDRVSPAIAAAIGGVEVNSPQYLFTGGVLESGSSAQCTGNTLFDLASLTKVFATTLISAEAILLGKISLDEKPFHQWPSVRILDLLKHTSGLPAWQNLFIRKMERRQIIDRALRIPLEIPAGTKTIYSDIGFIALGEILESRLKERIDVVFADLAKKYYGLSSMFYFPNNQKRHEYSHSAPTGYCPTRRRKLRGEVNDLNAYALGGVAPHAGLFGNINDVSKTAAFFLRSIHIPNTPITRILQQFTQSKGLRAIGFDRAEANGSTGGALSRHAFGHLGFTGTSFWIDPVAANGNGAYFVLLTNHLEASSRKAEIMQLRRDFHRVGMRWLMATMQMI